MHLRRAQRRLAHTVQTRADTGQEVHVHTRASVTAVSTAGGTTVDGAELVTVTVDGSAQVMPWVQAYSAAAPPANGDEVVVMLINKSPVLVGKIVGLPVI